MANTIATKLRIRPGNKIQIFNAPPSFSQALGADDLDLSLSDKMKDPDQIHSFFKSSKEASANVPLIFKSMKPGVLWWIYFPKGSSGIQTDLTRDKGWEILDKFPVLNRLTLISFNEQWSAFALRKETKVAALKKGEDHSEFIDTEKKTVKVPADLALLFKNHPVEKATYEKLAYSHRKEYIIWIISAKKEDTRQKRLNSMIEMLAKGSKNPTDK